MGDYEQSTTVQAAPDKVFSYLSDIHNLPTYFDRMTSATPGDGDEVRTTALVAGQEVEGTAWFTVEEDERMLSWGSEGPNDYHGELEVSASDEEPGASLVTVRLHTTRVDDGSIDEGLLTTLDNVRELVEA
jgi:uncharacterized membrane protein